MRWIFEEPRYWDDLLFTLYFSQEPLSIELDQLRALVESWYLVGNFGGYGGYLNRLQWPRVDRHQDIPSLQFSVDMGDSTEAAYGVLIRCLQGWSLREEDEELIDRLVIGELPGKDRRARQ